VPSALSSGALHLRGTSAARRIAGKRKMIIIANSIILFRYPDFKLLNGMIPASLVLLVNSCQASSAPYVFMLNITAYYLSGLNANTLP